MRLLLVFNFNGNFKNDKFLIKVQIQLKCNPKEILHKKDIRLKCPNME